MTAPSLPRAQAEIVGTDRRPSREWYEFFRQLLQFANDSGLLDPDVIANILARLDALEQEGDTFTIAGALSVKVSGTPASGAVQLYLDGDTALPGNFCYYRTGATGAKEWSAIDHNTVSAIQDAPNAVANQHYHMSATQADAVGLLFKSGNDVRATTADGVTATIIANASKILTVYSLTDLPAAVAGVITLANNTSYYITTAIDLAGARIVCGANVGLFGDTADNCSLTSTGLSAATALITSTSSINMESITIKDVGTALDLNDTTAQLNWENIVFQNVPTVGTIQNYANIVWGQCVLQNSAGLTITGTQGSIAFFECLFDGRTGATTLTIPAAAVVTRRVRMLYCAVACLPGETAFNVSASATIPDEGYILDNVAFAGGGTYLAGLDYTSNKALFFNCTGITNTSALCQYSMTGNATATVIGAAGTFVKVAGTTTASSLNQKFSTGTTQRATYAGAFTQNFRAVGFASMTSGNNQTLRMRIAKNGTTLAESNTLFKTTGSGEASAVGCQVILTLAPTDYVELFVTNDTSATNITVSDLNFTIVRLN
jgi:hypothetical protein